MWIGERRLTSSTRSICSLLYSLSFPVPGRPAFATNTSTSPTSAAKRWTSPRVRQVERARLDPLAEFGDEPVEHLGPAPGEDQVRAARVQRPVRSRDPGRPSRPSGGSGNRSTRLA